MSSTLNFWRKNPQWLEILVAAMLMLFHFAVVTRMLRVDVLFLGGDGARQAWQALRLLSTGHWCQDYSSPYESGLDSLFNLPFILIFGNTLRCLKVTAAFLSTMTVLVFYQFARRSYGLVAGAVLGFLLAASPQFLVNCAPTLEFAIPLEIALILLCGTFRGERWRRAEMLAAGLFTSLHAYFLFPFLGYQIAKLPWDDQPQARRRPQYFAAFGLGLLPWALKFLIWGGTYHNFGAGPWLGEFLRWNFSRWSHPFILAQDVWRQFTWSLGSLLIYGHATGPLSPYWIVWLWLLALIISLFFREARRWPLTLAACLILAGLFAAPPPSGGLGMRHMLAFLPFHWLMLGPVIEKVLSRAARSAVLCLLACAAVTGLAAVQSLAQKMSAHERVAANTESLVRLLAEDPKERVTVISGNQNLFFDLKFLAPDKSIDYVGIPDMLAARAGRIVIARSALIDPLGPPTTPLVRVARYFLSGRTTYDVWREKRD